MTFRLVSQDITKMAVDAIVNAANTDLAMGGGVCGAIFRAAGARMMAEACAPLAPIQTGQAVLTPAFALPCRLVIHTAGPVYHCYSPTEAQRLLRECYTASLKLAAQFGCQSIAFPLISSGIYGYPPLEALTVAAAAITDFLAAQEMDVYLSVLDKALLSAYQATQNT